MVIFVPERTLIDKLLAMLKEERNKDEPDREAMQTYKDAIAELRLQMKRKNGKTK